jgi:DEAD/DEAH box helicase domain-containing protein
VCVCDAQVLVSTNALEMGINIGGLDATVSLGMPSTICSFRQQAGRSGRSASPSLAVLLAKDRPLDQHYLQNPKEVNMRIALASDDNSDRQGCV